MLCALIAFGMRPRSKNVSCVFAILLLVWTAAVRAQGEEETPKEAECVMDGAHGNSNITGKLTLNQSSPKAPLRISGTLRGSITSGNHGFHVHEHGKLGNNCLDAGGHFNPEGKQHGAPNDAERHVGDLGNVLAQEDTVEVDIDDEVATLYGKHDVMGKAIVLHAGEDDLGKGQTNGSLSTGNAGARLQGNEIYCTKS